MNEIKEYTKKIFEDIKHIDENGNEYWFARELMEVLEYKEWRYFQSVIEKAQIACSQSKNNISYHFGVYTKTIKMPKNATKEVIDYKLSRYACYLIVQNANPKYETVALGQTYFAIQTRKMELTVEEYNKLTEDEKRLFRRKQVKSGNYNLNKIAVSSGVKDLSRFHNAGYKGLYNGETADDIFKRKKLRYREDILDNMGSEELADNIFRIAQTDAKLKRDNVDNEYTANSVHYEVGREVRNSIKRLILISFFSFLAGVREKRENNIIEEVSMLNYYDEIKNKLLNNEITKRVKDYSKNKSDLDTYYNVGKLLSEAGKYYGEGIIKQYSKKLIDEIDRKYDISTLKRMRQFYVIIEKGAPMEHQLSWSHYKILLPLKNVDIITYYINQIIERNLSKRQLQDVVKSKEYERLPEKTRLKLINKEDNKVEDFIKNPIIIRNPNNIEVTKEKVLQRLILEDIPSFLKELGKGFCFIENEYKIKIGNTFNYIDILLFNIEFNCYIVVELKVTELRKEYIGQVEVYMNYIDSNLRKYNQDKTIGIIICKKDNKYVIDYCSDKRILSKEYELV